MEVKFNDKILKPNFEKFTPEKAYILGICCGDAHLNLKQNRVELASRDQEFLNKFEKFIKEIYNINIGKYTQKIKKYKDIQKVYAQSISITQDLLKYDITKKGFRCKNWRAPKIVMETKDKEVIRNFLRGLYDSEGSIKPNHKGIWFGISNKKGLLDIKILLEKLRFKPSKIFKSNGIYNLVLTGIDNYIKFKKEIGFCATRKSKRLIEYFKNYKQFSQIDKVIQNFPKGF